MLKKIRIYCIIFISYSTLSAQPLTTIKLNFEKKYMENNTIEIAIGEIYFKFPDLLFIHVNDPVNQIFNYKKEKMEIYYPESNQAFMLNSNNPINMPFFQLFISVIKEDNGLSELGFTINSNQIMQDTLTTEWLPPKEVKNIIGKVVIKYFQNMIIESSAFNSKGKRILTTLYGNHYLYKGFNFPLKVIIKRNSGSENSIEETLYSNPKFDEELPIEVTDFSIPTNAIITELK